MAPVGSCPGPQVGESATSAWTPVHRAGTVAAGCVLTELQSILGDDLTSTTTRWPAACAYYTLSPVECDHLASQSLYHLFTACMCAAASIGGLKKLTSAPLVCSLWLLV